MYNSIPQAAIQAWDKLHADGELINIIVAALERQIATADWQRGIGIPHASTWLNQHRWEDELKAPPKPESRWIEEEVIPWLGED